MRCVNARYGAKYCTPWYTHTVPLQQRQGCAAVHCRDGNIVLYWLSVVRGEEIYGGEFIVSCDRPDVSNPRSRKDRGLSSPRLPTMAIRSLNPAMAPVVVSMHVSAAMNALSPDEENSSHPHERCCWHI
jgi:hypothetical protein